VEKEYVKDRIINLLSYYFSSSNVITIFFTTSLKAFAAGLSGCSATNGFPLSASGTFLIFFKKRL